MDSVATTTDLVARCVTCNMSLCADDSDCGATGCTAERDITRANDWKRRALVAERRLQQLETAAVQRV